MKGVPYQLQGKGVLKPKAEVSAPQPNWKKNGSCRSAEPTSVLDTRRSPSPPTSSTSTLSSSFGGGTGSTDSAGMAAVSDNTPHKWLPDSSSAAGAASEGGGSSSGGSRKEEWANDLQPIPASLEIGAGGSEKCGLGMEEWANVLSGSASSPSNDQSIFHWLVSDLEDPSLKQLLQSGGGPPELESSGAGIGISDAGFCFENVSASGNANANAFSSSTPLSSASADFSSMNGNSSTSKLLPVQNPTNPVPNFNVSCFGSNNISNLPNPIFSSASNNLSLPLSLPPSVLCQQQQQQQQLDPLDEKPQLFNPPNLFLNQLHSSPPQNPAFLLPPAYAQQEQHLLLQPPPKRHHPIIPDPGFQIPKAPYSESGQEVLLRRQQQQNFSNLHLLPQHLQHKPAKMKVIGAGDDSQALQQQQQQQLALVEQLFKAAELVENGNTINARGILARLNQQLSPVGKPLQRAAFYFKEALQMLLDNSAAPQPASPVDVFFKISSFKVFSEVSPIVQFVNFTSNQVLLEALDGFDRIHIVDFDIGIGGQWASFMQELALRNGGAPSLKITAFSSSSSQNPLELFLTRENLSHYANELCVPFEFSFFDMDSLDLSSAAALPILDRSENEVVAVNLPIGSSTPLLLRLVKHFSPKIVLSVDTGCDRSDLPFSQHFFNALQSHVLLLDSLDALNVHLDPLQKIEKFMFQPKIESIVLGRHRAREKMPLWRSLFTSAGFSPLLLSNFTETQADSLLNRPQLRGFHAEKREASLCLCWQRGELVSVSAWRC